MSDNVIPLGNITSLDMDPDAPLRGAIGKCPDGSLVIGWDKGGEFYFASSIADGRTILWLLEQAKLALLEAAE